MLLGMSDDFQGQRGGSDFRERLMSDAEHDQQEIQDWLNANGALVFGAIVAVIVVFFILQAVTG